MASWATAAPIQIEITLQFDDGQISGPAGCKHYSSLSYKLEGNVFGELLFAP